MLRILIALAAIVCAGVPRLAAAEPVSSVLARLDKDAAAFRDLTAEVRKKTYTAVLDETAEENGAVWIRRAGRSLEMRIEFTGTNTRSLHFEGTKGEIYYPKINTVQIYDLGKSRSLVDQFLLLGFGTSGKELARSYSIKVAGEEPVGGQATTRLELTPKSEEVRKYVTAVTLWIPLNAGYPVQQRFQQPGGDYTVIAYANVKSNPSLPATEFKLKLPKDVKVERPQKSE